MRVISGKYKHRRFDVPSTFKARPTTDFAKESLFNVLSGYFDFEEVGAALDLFSGTGSISLELLSRGCRKVVSIEKDPQHYAFISKLSRELGAGNWYPFRGDVFRYLSRSHEKFDLIFADPPYQLEGIAEIPDKVFASGLLSSGGMFVLEHGKTQHFECHEHFLDHRSYGSVNFSFFRAAEPGAEPSTP